MKREMNIVLDTNVIFDNWYLSGPYFSLLENYLRLSSAKLFVPEIVVLETKNLFKRQITPLIRSMAKLRRHLPDEAALEKLPDVDEKSTEYDTKLDQRLAELGAEKPGYSDIPHDAIVARALGVRKPFRESDRGYRDTLLWEVILHKIANKDKVTFFISNNHKDFADKPKGGLHADLIKDLVSAGLPNGCVQYYSNLNTFIDEQVKSKLKRAKADETVRQLRDGSYKGFSLEKWFAENRDAIIEKVSDKIDTAFAFPFDELEDSTVTYIEDPEEIEIIEVARYERDEEIYHIEVCATAAMTVDVFVSKADYYGGLAETVPLDVWDFDWNERYIWAVIELELPLSFSLVFDASKETVEDFEVSEVGEFWGWCRFCRAQIMSDAAEECWSCGKSFA